MYLETRDLTAGYGKKQVLQGVSLGVGKSEIVTLLGHNGAGKSTTLQVIAGLLKPTSGAITFDGHDITRRDIADNVKNGISLVPQGKAFFFDLSVEENLLMAGYTLPTGSLTKERMEGVYEFFPRLRARRSQEAGTLSGGEQRMLSIGMALVMSPRVMLLDEPTFGLAPLLATELMDRITEISQEFGTSVLLVQDSITRALSVSQRGYIMKSGQIVYQDTKEALAAMPEKDLWDLF
jgi:branched-chain amino acid transport system ATP-binding protein